MSTPSETTTTTTTAPPAAPAAPATEAPAAPEAEAPETTAEGAEETGEPGETFDPARALAQVRKANAQAKAMRERAKAAEDKVATLEVSAAEAAQLKTQLMRAEMALELGLPMSIAKRLQGDTPEAMKADAEELLDQMVPKAPPRGTRPVEALQTGSGKAGGTGPVQLTQAELDRLTPDGVIAAKDAGQLNTLLGIKPI